MKRVILFILLCVLLASCNVVNVRQEEPADPYVKYTEAAKTVSVQLTGQALLTPSATMTSTPEPTATMTSTPEPTPTVPTATPTWGFHESGTVKAPIFVYYHIAESKADNPDFSADDEENISTEQFKEQMLYLHENGFSPITLPLLVTTIREGAETPRKPVVITFDGGTGGIYTKAFPVMQEMGYVGHIFITVNNLGQTGYLTNSQVKELMAAGWIIGSKGMNGYDLTSDYNLLSDEISGSRLKLEQMFQVDVKYFSYPFGRTDDVILQRINPWGYDAAVGKTWYETSEHSAMNLYYLARFEVLNSWNVDDFAKALY